MLAESYHAGPLNGLSVASGYDQYLRRSSLSLASSSTLQTINYGYDAASRLETVTDNTHSGTPYSATYTYVANSPLVGNIAFMQSSTTRMTTSNSFDHLNRLTSIQALAGLSTINSYSYQLNAANQRTNTSLADASHWVYSYDRLGQVISGNKYWADGTPVAGQQFAYSFDDIGNRTTAASGGNQSGANLRTQYYTANDLNQYTQRTVPGYATVLGSANSNATVTLWNQDGSHAPTLRKGEYFRAELPVNNNNGPVWLTLTNLAVLNDQSNPDIMVATVGNKFLPNTNETFWYDADGNLTNDGRWTYTWDGENHLVMMQTNAAAGVPLAAKRKLECAYDSQGRRIRKVVSAWDNTVVVSNLFVYDGWNLVAELNATNNSVIRSYTWGLDLSGSQQGAGGVGGLLEVNDAINGVQFVAYDGNGNVAALVKATDGNISAQYEYGPFGEVTRATGPMAKINPFRFSTKYEDDETDLFYYGYRYYNASPGRWISRDPIEERGSRNLYCFAENRPVIAFDLDGRMTLREFPTEQRASPTTGPYAGYDGLTWFNAFEPDAKVYKSINAPCCWKIFLPGHADLYYWWVKNAPGHDPGATAQSHEMQHVAIHRDTYNSFNASASDYVGVCFSKGKAECWKSVINGPLKAAYLAHNHTANLQLDAWYRGSEIPAAIQAENTASDTLAKEEEKCASME